MGSAQRDHHVEGLTTELKEDQVVPAVPNVRRRRVAETEVSTHLRATGIRKWDELRARDTSTGDVDPK